MLDYYKNNWNLKYSGTDEELTQLLERASDIVDNAICMSGYTVDSVPDLYCVRVKKAVCAQADYIISHGGVDSLTEGSFASATLGKFSYSENTSSSGGTSPVDLCDLAAAYLAPTGLLYRGVTVL